MAQGKQLLATRRGIEAVLPYSRAILIVREWETGTAAVSRGSSWDRNDETTAKAVFRLAGGGAMFCYQAKPRVRVEKFYKRQQVKYS